MPSKPAEIYQGSDWLTYRWSVAQAFDTLDRVRDLCLQMPVAVGGTAGKEPARFEAPAEDIADMFGYVVELCDDLTGELDIVHADIVPPTQANIMQAWIAFEMRLHLCELRRRALKETEVSMPPPGPPDEILALASRIKALLKQIDQ